MSNSECKNLLQVLCTKLLTSQAAFYLSDHYLTCWGDILTAFCGIYSEVLTYKCIWQHRIQDTQLESNTWKIKITKEKNKKISSLVVTAKIVTIASCCRGRVGSILANGRCDQYGCGWNPPGTFFLSSIFDNVIKIRVRVAIMVTFRVSFSIRVRGKG